MENSKVDENKNGGEKSSPTLSHDSKAPIPQNVKYGEGNITFSFPANGGATISADKIVLSGKSEVFQKQFIASENSVKEERIVITDISFDIFNKFIKYIYGYELDIYEENYLEVLYAAQKYFVNGLTYKVIKFLKEFINKKNLYEHFEFIEKFDIRMLNDHMKKIILTHPLEIIEKLNTTAPHKRILEIILQADALPCTEYELYLYIYHWLTRNREKTIQNGESLRNGLGKLIYLIRFPTMSVLDIIRCGERPSPLKDREIVDFLLWKDGDIFSDTLQFYSVVPRKELHLKDTAEGELEASFDDAA